MLASKLLEAAGNSTTPTYIEDVFSTYLYTGTSGAQSINNGIDVSGKGGLVWLKNRTTSQDHGLFDTARGDANYLCSDLTNGQFYYPNNGITFSSTGFNTDAASYFGGTGAGSTDNYVSWTFRKQPKFFDVVTYTGTGSNRTVSHNLGSTPGVIIIKQISASGRGWITYHRSIGATGYLDLSQTNATDTWSIVWNNTAPTSTEFTVGTFAGVNESGQTYVAYLFAHDAGGFGLTGTDNVISCGSFAGASSTPGPLINLGWEPQWILFKKVNSAQDWFVQDNMRGMPNGSSAKGLRPNTADAEIDMSQLTPTATGFFIGNALGTTSDTYIYIAIRRGPMKVPTDATKVFAIDTRHATTPSFVSNFPVDWYTYRAKSGSDWYSQTRLTDSGTLYFNLTSAENAIGGLGSGNFAYQTGVMSSGVSIPDLFSYMFRRAPNFFDEVCYTGTGATTAAFTHNLGVVPEMMIVKSRSNASHWMVYAASQGNTKELQLNRTNAVATNTNTWGSTTPTSTQFTIGCISGIPDTESTNDSGYTYVAYLFASCPGVSKIGSFTNSGSNVDVDCGFASGARFVLMKQTDGAGSWYVYDTARGITTGNDPYLTLNTTAAEVTTNNGIAPLSSGFTLIGNQWNTGTYIYLAIA